MKSSIVIKSLFAAFALTGGVVQGAPIASWDFNSYNIGQLFGQDGWAGSTNGLHQVVTEAPGDNAVKLIRNDAVGSIINNGISHAIDAQTGNFYFSMSFQYENFNNDDFYWVRFDQGSSENRSLGFALNGGSLIGRVRNDGASNVRKDTDILSGFSNAEGPVEAGLFILGYISKTGSNGNNFDRLDIALNPTDFNNITWVTTAIAAGAQLTDQVTSISRFAARVGSSSSNFDDGDIVTIDDIRIGTELADVVNIPEPSAMLMVLCGAALMGVRRSNKTLS